MPSPPEAHTVMTGVNLLAACSITRVIFIILLNWPAILVLLCFLRSEFLFDICPLPYIPGERRMKTDTYMHMSHFFRTLYHFANLEFLMKIILATEVRFLHIFVLVTCPNVLEAAKTQSSNAS